MRVRASGEHLAGIFETCFVLLLGAILGRSWDDLGSLLGGLGALLAALREQGSGAFSDPTSSQQVTWF